MSSTSAWSEVAVAMLYSSRWRTHAYLPLEAPHSNRSTIVLISFSVHSCYPVEISLWKELLVYSVRLQLSKSNFAR